VGGKNTPACGFAFSWMTWQHWSNHGHAKSREDCTYQGKRKSEDDIKIAFEAAAALRNAGLVAEFDFYGSQLEAVGALQSMANQNSASKMNIKELKNQ